MESGWRYMVEGVSDDLRFVERAARGAMVVLLSFGLIGLALLPTGWPGAVAEVAVLAVVIALGMELRRMASGRVPRLLPALARGAAAIAVIVGALYLALVRWSPRRLGLQTPPELVPQVIGCVFVSGMLLVGGLIAIPVACAKAARLRAFCLEGVLTGTVNLLEWRRLPGSSALVPLAGERRVRLVVRRVSHWPAVAGWSFLAAVAWVCAALVAGTLQGTTWAISHVVPFPVPNLLPLLGPRSSRPLFEASGRAKHRARGHRAVDARSVLSADGRPPVLLLRSFADDKRILRTFDRPAWMGRPSETFEETLTVRLRRFGPVVAVGRPGERVPPAGAAREYISGDEAWRARVEELIAAATVIVVLAGKTVNLGWELTRIEGLRALRKAVVVIPAEERGEVADRLIALMRNLRGTAVSAAIRDHLHDDAVVFCPGLQRIVELASSRRAAHDYQVALEIGVLAVVAGVPPPQTIHRDQFPGSIPGSSASSSSTSGPGGSLSSRART